MDNSFATGYALGSDNAGNRNGGFGGGDWIWAIIILFFFFGGGLGGGFGGGGGINSAAGQGALTRADLCSEFNFNNLNNNVRGLQQDILGVNSNISNGFRGVDNAICQLGWQMQQGQHALSTQISDCCCNTQRGIDGINYNMATNTAALQNTINNATRDIIDSQNAGTRAILDKMCQDQIANLQQEVQVLRLAASQSDQNAVLRAAMADNTAEILRRTAPVPVPAYTVPNPNCCNYNYACVG